MGIFEWESIFLAEARKISSRLFLLQSDIDFAYACAENIFLNARHERLGFFCSLLFLMSEENQGNTYLSYDRIFTLLDKYFSNFAHLLKPCLEQAWKAFELHSHVFYVLKNFTDFSLSSSTDYFVPPFRYPFVVVCDKNDMLLSSWRFFSAEYQIALYVQKNLQCSSSWYEELPQAIFDFHKFSLTAEQSQAVKGALASRLFIVSGGPGTGKTSILASILRALAWKNIDFKKIALAAPTGKAAHRMQEAINKAFSQLQPLLLTDPAVQSYAWQSQTVHRLLGWTSQGLGFTYHEDFPLPYTYVIVDEASMLDTLLMAQLLRALPSDGHLILLGDAYQLPSVEAGSVFQVLSSELKKNYPAFTCFLTQSQRARPDVPGGKEIIGLAEALKLGNPENKPSAHLIAVRDDSWGQPGVWLWHAEKFAEFAAFFERWFERFLSFLQAQGFSTVHECLEDVFEKLHNTFKLLSPLRRGLLGCEGINAWFHMRWARYWNMSEHKKFLHGEPVLITQNNYEQQVFNGDQGFIFCDFIQNMAYVCVRSSGGFRKIPLTSLENMIEHAYCITVHKSQGSEYAHVGFVLSGENNSDFLSRELLYTAVTRASREVVVIGKPDIMDTCEPAYRQSLLSRYFQRK